TTYGAMLCDKLGLDSIDMNGEDPLLIGLFQCLEATETDMTIFFRGLAGVPVDVDGASDDAVLDPIRDAFYDETALQGPHRAVVLAWLRAYAARVRAEGRPREERVGRMQRANPKYVLRNYL